MSIYYGLYGLWILRKKFYYPLFSLFLLLILRNISIKGQFIASHPASFTQNQPRDTGPVRASRRRIHKTLNG